MLMDEYKTIWVLRDILVSDIEHSSPIIRTINLKVGITNYSIVYNINTSEVYIVIEIIGNDPSGKSTTVLCQDHDGEYAIHDKLENI